MTKSPKGPTAPSNPPSGKGDSAKAKAAQDASPAAPTAGGKPGAASPKDVKASEVKASEVKASDAKAVDTNAAGPAPVKDAAKDSTKEAPKEPAKEPAKPAPASAAKPGPAKPEAAKATPAPAVAATAPRSTPTSSAPTAQPSPAVRRPLERSGPQRAASASPAPREAGTSLASLIVAGLVGGLVAGAGFIAYDLMRTQPAGDPERIAALEQRVEQLAGREPAAPDLSGVEARLSDAEAQASQALSTAQEAAGRAIPEVPTDAIEANTQAIAELRSEVESLQPRIDEVAGQVTAIQQEFSPQWRDAASRAAAANRVAVALEAGRPYPEAHQSLAALGAPQEMLAAIEPFAEGGAPGPSAFVAQLREAFAGTQSAQPQEAPPAPDAVGGFFQRLAERAVTVETVNADQRPEPVTPQMAAAVETALLAGDFETAYAAWERLPPRVQETTQNFAQNLRARIEAAQAADAIANEAIAALAVGR